VLTPPLLQCKAAAYCSKACQVRPAVQEPRGEATPAKSVATTPAMTKEHESGGGGSSSSSEGDARAASTTHPVSRGGDSRIGEIIGKILSAMAATDGPDVAKNEASSSATSTAASSPSASGSSSSASASKGAATADSRYPCNCGSLLPL
jgi:hypothetical protein